MSGAAPFDVRALANRMRDGRSSRELWLLAAILVLAFLLRLLWVLFAMREPQGLHDPTFYFIYAGQIADGEGYRLLDGSPTAYYPVGYAATLGGVYALVSHTPIPDNFPDATGAFQIVLGVATVWLVYEVARRLFNSTVGLLSALWLALFPNLIFHTATYLTETLFNMIVMAALAVLFWSDWRERRIGWGRLVLFGLLLGYSALVRPISLLFLPLLLIVWLGAGFPWHRTAAYAGVAVVATFAVILPWTVRNIIVMDSPVLISTNLGDDLCIGHYEGALGGFALPEVCFNDAKYAGLKRPEIETRRDSDNREHAIDFAAHNPRTELKLLSRKAYYTWDHDHDGLNATESYNEDPFIGSHLQVEVVPSFLPIEQAPAVATGLAAVTGIPAGEITSRIEAGRATDPDAGVTIVRDIDPGVAQSIREAPPPGVRFVVPQSHARDALARVADIYFFITISLGGIGLIGFVLSPRDPRRIFFLLALLAFAGSMLPFFGDARFHLPATPLLVVSAAWALAEGLRRAPALFAVQPVTGSAAVEGAEGKRPVSEPDALQDSQAH